MAPQRLSMVQQPSPVFSRPPSHEYQIPQRSPASDTNTTFNSTTDASNASLDKGKHQKRFFQNGLFKSSQDPDSNGKKGEQRPRTGILRFCTKRNLIFLSIPLIMLIVLLATLLTLLPKRHGHASAHRGDLDGSGNPVVQPANGAVIDLSYGKFKGVEMHNNITYWLGMKYAKAPTGDLRFAAPQDPDKVDGVHEANKALPGCVGVGPGGKHATEDCLWMDVYAPTHATNTSKLPVFYFIQGGGLNSASGHFNASGLIAASGNKIVVAQISYRTGIFGFLASEELQKNASLNNGLKDQHAALQWINKHIDKFGGDPGKVTIGGQSAGAGCVASHLTAYGGDNKDLFHAALLQSASMPAIRTVKDSQFQYDNLLKRVKCDDAKDTLHCLRQVSTETILKNALTDPFPDGAGGKPVFAYNTVIDGDVIKEVPVSAYAAGRVANVPVIFGDVTNEGTVFTSKKNVTNADSARDFLKNTFPRFNETSLDKVSELYEFDTKTSQSAWDKGATAYGDVRYTCAGIQLSDLVAKNGKKGVWNYRYDVEGDNKQNGVAHGSDLRATFGNIEKEATKKSAHADVTPILQRYWTSFIMSHDPNLFKHSDAPEWKQWKSGGSGQRLRFENQDSVMESLSDVEKKRCDYLAEISVYLEQ